MAITMMMMIGELVAEVRAHPDGEVKQKKGTYDSTAGKERYRESCFHEVEASTIAVPNSLAERRVVVCTG